MMIERRDRLGRVTMPEEDELTLPVLQFWIDVLRICARYKLSMTSGVRNPDRNKSVGGHPLSRHVTFEAIDLVHESEIQAKDAFQELREMGYYGYVKPRGAEEHLVWQIHIQRVAVRQDPS